MIVSKPIHISFLSSLLFFLAVTLVTPKTLKAQQPNLENVSKREVKVTARNAVRIGDTYIALNYYEEWLKREPKNIGVAFQVANLLRISKSFTKAEKKYKEVIEAAPASFPKSYFYLAQVQMTLGKYKEAKENFLAFEDYARGLDDRKYRKLTDIGLESCEFAMQAEGEEKLAVVKHLNGELNKAHIEFSPVPYDENTLIYGSLRKDQLEVYDRQELDSNTLPRRKFYVAVKEGGAWIPKGELTGPFNREDMDVGNAVLRQDGSRIYFTLCKRNEAHKVICHLYYADKRDKGWTSAKKIEGEVNLPNYTTTQPAIGRESKRNREIIYFASDRPGGKGEMDIWYTEYRWKRREFRSPRNAGSKINTIATEATPYYDLETHRLYFSSNGLVGLGGLDIYRANGEKSKWEEPEHMGKDLNSSADDLDFTLHPKRKGGFIVSNRKGGANLNDYCCDDIYEFNYTRLLDIKLKGMARTKEGCLDSTWLKLYIKNGEDEKYLSRKLLMKDCDFEVNLEPGMDYVVELNKDGYFSRFEEISTENVNSDKEFELNFETERMSEESIVMEEIEYGYNSAELTAEAKEKLSQSLFGILRDNPSIKVEVAAHTDSKGSAAYNKSLSDKRAQAVVDFLTEKGIASSRLIAKGYGETKPIAPNEKSDGSDNPEGRAQNRRTEFKVIGNLPTQVDDDY
ncbi:MAG: OmpA family protein [Vicingaceae bacterium]